MSLSEEKSATQADGSMTPLDLTNMDNYDGVYRDPTSTIVWESSDSVLFRVSVWLLSAHR
jgi:hypothetical protein